MADKFTIKQNDTSPSIKYDLKLADGQSLDSATVKFIMADADGVRKVNEASGSVYDATNEIVSYDWASGDTDTAGSYNAEFQVTFQDGSVETFPNDSYIRVTVFPEL